MVTYRLSKPGIVKQPSVGTGDDEVSLPVCWACALSSWLEATRGVSWSYSSIIQMFQMYCNGNALDLAYFGEIANSLSINMDYEEIDRADLTFDYVYEKMFPLAGTSGNHLYIVMEGKNPAHVVVAYGIQRDNTDYIAIMDPLRGVLAAPTLSTFRNKATGFLIGWHRR
ncbi:hypothetical protein [Bradyrhizobium sp. CW10]|uniref:hypothetical protein n=1 Tax=Bradyrhizobium sp. CW10 TaxID=2782683 RepID=UPI001FFBD16A|nr:hypothetical protein [Bradyrhizobium sp. CW10]MCK1469983.1 hypothetical protein [Bradyrhizobium sp. CW10]